MSEGKRASSIDLIYTYCFSRTKNIFDSTPRLLHARPDGLKFLVELGRYRCRGMDIWDGYVAFRFPRTIWVQPKIGVRNATNKANLDWVHGVVLYTWFLDQDICVILCIPDGRVEEGLVRYKGGIGNNLGRWVSKITWPITAATDLPNLVFDCSGHTLST